MFSGEDTQDYCRACLSPIKDAPNKGWLFETHTKVPLCIQFSTITQISVESNDDLPEYLCQKCVEQIEAAFKFRTTAMESDNYLRATKDDVLEDCDLIVESLEEEIEVEEISGLQCDECGKNFKEKKNLQVHMRLHTGYLLKYCPTCGKGFQKQFFLDRHVKLQKCVEKLWMCEECDVTFENHDDFGKHKKDIHGFMKKKKVALRKKVQCTICDGMFSNAVELRAHLMSHKDVATLEGINLFKDYLFDMTQLPVQCDHDFLADLVGKKLESSDHSRFYQILGADCRERDLSDTDTDEDTCVRDNAYTCSKCSLNFLTSRDIMKHMNDDHDMMVFEDKCAVCSLQFPCKTLLVRHLRQQCENAEKQFVCQICSARYQWEENLRIHNSIVHQEAPRRYTCDVCTKTFVRGEHLERHKRTHNPSEKKFECPNCQRKFNRKDNLKSHMKIHEPKETKSQPSFLCVHCGRSFASSSNLIVHVRRHTGEKPHRCAECGKGFPRKSDLKCHARSHTGEKPNLCPVCGKGFSRANKLARHMRIHLGIKPYQCTYCDRAFTQSNDLTLHIRRHTGDKPYVCGEPSCEERFIQGTALRAHQRATGHSDNPSNPNSYKVVSVNNPKRMQTRTLPKTPQEIRPVLSKKRKKNEVTEHGKVVVERLVEVKSEEKPAMVEAATANFGVTLLNLELPAMFQISE